MSAEAIVEGFKQLYEATEKKKESTNHEKLRIDFAKSEILEGLGYAEEDIYYEEIIESRKRTDIHCQTDFGDVHVVIEVKNPSQDNLAKDFEADLRDKYVLPLNAEYGALYNGLSFILYERVGDDIQRVNNYRPEALDEGLAEELRAKIGKPDSSVESVENVVDHLDKFDEPDERISLFEDSSRVQFYENFQLGENSVFGELVTEMASLFAEEKGNSNFLQGAYEFWKESYARKLSKSQIPKKWDPLFDETGLSKSSQEDRYKFTFALESSYALLARLILSKTAEDYDIPGSAYSDHLRYKISKQLGGGVEALGVAYPKVLLGILSQMRHKFINSVFETDLFYWWSEVYDEITYDQILSNRTFDSQTNSFGRSVGKLLLTVYRYDFSKVEEDDLLGELYQQYFERETRKALGEFYTPKPIVNYILDSVGYEGRKILNKNILDPACGSGTFLVEALDRYLEVAEESGYGDRKGWRAVLNGLCDEFHIVGFDVHPFATIMAQVQFTLKLLPYYRRALEEESSPYALSQIPILRTDSLEKEAEGDSDLDYSSRGRLSKNIELPVHSDDSGDKFFDSDFTLPLYRTVRNETAVKNTEDYYAAIQALFSYVKKRADSIEYEGPEVNLDELEMEFESKPRLRDCHPRGLAHFFSEDAEDLLKKVQTLKSDFDDGRLVKSIEDVLTATVLKGDEYDFVVGNPPYVSTNDLPDKQKRDWSSEYEYVADETSDIYVPFMERGVNWLDSSGKMSYIVSNRFLMNNYARNLRSEMKTDVAIDEIVDLRDAQVFEDALNYPVILTVASREKESHTFPAARVFETADDGQELLDSIDERLSAIEDADDHVVGSYCDAFYVRYTDLEQGGWYLMPAAEREVFDEIDAAGENLETFTQTESGGFQGVSTSKDDRYVLRKIEDKGKYYRVVPKGGGDPFTIEADAVRPFLFGEDVSRWTIDWKNWVVIFPYQKYDGEYKLTPSREYNDEFDYGDEYIEDKYDELWDYLTRDEVQADLRGRDGGTFEEGASGEHRWYGMAYPRNINCYDSEKIIIQVSSDDPDIAHDAEGRFVFTGGGTSGINGILPGNITAAYLTGLMNSKLLDFYLKHVSQVYTGSSYSYGDQFIKLLPIKKPQSNEEMKQDLCSYTGEESDNKENVDTAQEIETKAEKLRTITDLESRINSFPIPQFNKLDREGKIAESFELKHTTERRYSNLNIDLSESNEYEIKLGKDDYIREARLDSEIKREFIIEALDGERFTSGEQITLSIPKSDADARKVIELWEDQKARLADEPTVEELEAEINDCVFSLYGTEDENREVVETFLTRF